MTKLCVLNRSTVVTDDEVEHFCGALQLGMNELAEAWNKPPLQVTMCHTAPADAWQLVLLDDTDIAEDLGYHQLTASGLPLGKAFVGTDLKYGLAWTCTAAHEAYELFIDPTCDATVNYGYDGSMWRAAIEVCDPVEDDEDGIWINGVLLSNATMPAYWSGAEKGPYDLRGLLQTPLPTLRSGGYLQTYDFSKGAYEQTFGEASPRDRARMDRPRGRMDRRNMPQQQWKRSAA